MPSYNNSYTLFIVYQRDTLEENARNGQGEYILSNGLAPGTNGWHLGGGTRDYT